MSKSTVSVRLNQNDSLDFSNLPPVQSRTRGSKLFVDGEPGIATNDNIPSGSGKDSRTTRKRLMRSGQKDREIVSRLTEEETTKASATKQSDYLVGYGKPPLHTRFKKGQSGNPKGRTKGARNLRSLYLEERDAKVAVTENGKRRMVTKGAIAIKTLFSNVAKGQAKSFDQVLKLESLTEGRPDGGTNQRGEFSPGQPLAQRNAELLDIYFEKRMAALKAGGAARKSGVDEKVRRPTTPRAPTTLSPPMLAKNPSDVDKKENQKEDGRIPVLLSQQALSVRTLPLRAIKDD